MAYKILKQGEADFCFVDGMKLVPRAGLELSEDCSTYFKSMLIEAINRGWIKSVARVPDVEYTWEKIAL
jgi:hypothetical protein